MAEDHRVHGKSNAPGNIVEERGQGKVKKVLDQQLIVKKHIRRIQPDVLAEQGNDHTAQKLCHTGNDGCQSDSCRAQLRRSEQSEDKDGVQEDVQHKGKDIQEHGDGHPTDAAQDGEINLYDAPAKVRDGHKAQVSGSDRDQLGVFCEHLHHQLRRKKREGGKDKGDQDGKAKRDPFDNADRLQILFAPILRAQHRSACAKPVVYHEQDVGVVGGQRYGGDRGLSHIVEHDHIGRVDRGAQKVLYDDRDDEFQYFWIKA